MDSADDASHAALSENSELLRKRKRGTPELNAVGASSPANSPPGKSDLGDSVGCSADSKLPLNNPYISNSANMKRKPPAQTLPNSVSAGSMAASSGAGSAKFTYKPRGSALDAETAEDGEFNPFNGRRFSPKYREILQKRRTLPVSQRHQDFLDAFYKNQVLVLVGETGSGKTTQIPQFIAYALLPHLRKKKIACTQPRRVAAMSVAKRVADEMDVNLGEEVGYSIRFEDCTSPRTFLKYATDGMLLREYADDQDMSGYDAVIIDEAHERTIQTDLLMGLLKCVCKRRPEFKLIIMSATLQAEKFQKYFNNAPLLTISGRMFPVEILYTEKSVPHYVEECVDTVLTIHCNEGKGDILVFLTGEEEIEDACKKIRANVGRAKLQKKENYIEDMVVYPLYSSLPSAQQQLVFEPAAPRVRKVIVSTNIAETSITIDGIVYVVDSGFCKQKVYNPRVRIESLQVTAISQAAADQRAGRAGRTQPGKCYRMYTHNAYHEILEKETYPEMMRSSMSATVLSLLEMNVEGIHRFDFMDPPSPESFMRALELLLHLKAIDETPKITALGRQMARFPLEPEYAKMLIESGKYNCCDHILTVVAMMNVPNVFVRPPKFRKESDEAKAQFSSPQGDHLTMLNVYENYISNGRSSEWCMSNFLSHRSLKNAESVRTQLERMLKRFGLYRECERQKIERERSTFENLRKCILSGFILQAAKHIKGPEYKTINDKRVVRIHPSSTLVDTPQFLMYSEYVITKAEYLRNVLSIERDWLIEMLPSVYSALIENGRHVPPASASRNEGISKNSNSNGAKFDKRRR